MGPYLVCEAAAQIWEVMSQRIAEVNLDSQLGGEWGTGRVLKRDNKKGQKVGMRRIGAGSGGKAPPADFQRGQKRL